MPPSDRWACRCHTDRGGIATEMRSAIAGRWAHSCHTRWTRLTFITRTDTRRCGNFRRPVLLDRLLFTQGFPCAGMGCMAGTGASTLTGLDRGKPGASFGCATRFTRPSRRSSWPLLMGDRGVWRTARGNRRFCPTPDRPHLLLLCTKSCGKSGSIALGSSCTCPRLWGNGGSSGSLCIGGVGFSCPLSSRRYILFGRARSMTIIMTPGRTAFNPLDRLRGGIGSAISRGACARLDVALMACCRSTGRDPSAARCPARRRRCRWRWCLWIGTRT